LAARQSGKAIAVNIFAESKLAVKRMRTRTNAGPFFALLENNERLDFTAETSAVNNSSIRYNMLSFSHASSCSTNNHRAILSQRVSGILEKIFNVKPRFKSQVFRSERLLCRQN
jgi:hypothetical protein